MQNVPALGFRNVLMAVTAALYAASLLLPAEISNRGHSSPGCALLLASLKCFPVGLPAFLPNVMLGLAFAALAQGRPGRAASFSLSAVPLAGLSGLALAGMGCCGSYSTPSFGYWAWIGSMLLFGLGALSLNGFAPRDASVAAYPVGSNRTGPV